MSNTADPALDMAAALSTQLDIWSIDLDGGSWPSAAELPPRDRERAESLRPPVARRRWAAGRWGVRMVLARYLGGASDSIELRSNDRGKPHLPGAPPPLRFNLSHSGGLALIALTSDREVGIDVEEIDPHRDFVRLAEVGLGEEVAATIRATPETARSAAFYEAWVRHEATAKCFGLGLGAPLPRAPLSVSLLDAGEGMAAAVAVAGSRPLELRSFSLP